MIVRRHLSPALGHLRVDELAPQDVQRYMDQKLKGGLSRRSVQYHHAVLRRALRIAESWGLVGRNVATLVTPPAPQRRAVTPLTPEEARRLIAALDGDRDQVLIATALGTGLRQSELLGLGWSDVDLIKGVLRVTKTLQRHDGAFHFAEPKTERSKRAVALSLPLTEALKRHRQQQLRERLVAGPLWQGDEWDDLVFGTELGAPRSGFALPRQFQRHLQSAGLPRQRFHDLRHASATYMLSEGISLRVVMEVLGHSTINVTANIYGHVMPEATRDAADKVGALLLGAS